jgi:hypothetical protein
MNDLDTIIATMYESVCFEAGQRPDWARQHDIFASRARLVRITDDGVFEFDVASYEANLNAMIDSGLLPSFWEGEVWRETRQFGEMAHVLSAYETRRSRGGELINRGVNSIQLYRRDGRWWISAMIWRREGKDVTIPSAPGERPDITIADAGPRPAVV